MNRREFLIRAAGLVVFGPEILSGCASTQPFPPESTKIPEDFKKKAVSEIGALPDSIIKRALESKVIPLLETKPPFNLGFVGVWIPVNNVTVEESLSRGGENYVDGLYSSRLTNFVDYRPVRAFATKIPLLGILKASEQAEVPADLKLPDGTWYLSFDGTTGSVLDKTLHPFIAVNVKWDGKPDSVQYIGTLTTLGYIKEACTLLLDILRMGLTIEMMKQFNLPTHIDAKDPYGNIENISIIPEAFVRINNNRGRSAALMDIAAYLLALKALSSTNSYQVLKKLGPIDQSIDRLITEASLGNTERDIFFKSYDWVLNTLELQTFHHQGDINKVP